MFFTIYEKEETIRMINLNHVYSVVFDKKDLEIRFFFSFNAEFNDSEVFESEEMFDEAEKKLKEIGIKSIQAK